MILRYDAFRARVRGMSADQQTAEFLKLPSVDQAAFVYLRSHLHKSANPNPSLPPPPMQAPSTSLPPPDSTLQVPPGNAPLRISPPPPSNTQSVSAGTAPATSTAGSMPPLSAEQMSRLRHMHVLIQQNKLNANGPATGVTIPPVSTAAPTTASGFQFSQSQQPLPSLSSFSSLPSIPPPPQHSSLLSNNTNLTLPSLVCTPCSLSVQFLISSFSHHLEQRLRTATSTTRRWAHRFHHPVPIQPTIRRILLRGDIVLVLSNYHKLTPVCLCHPCPRYCALIEFGGTTISEQST